MQSESYFNAQAQWQKYPERSVWQHPLWATFQHWAGRKNFMISTGDAYALVIRHELPMGLCWLEIPRGPLFKSEKDKEIILQKIKKRAKEEKAIFVRMSPYEELKMKNLKLKIASADRQPQTSLILDLSLSEEKILAQMKPKGRYNIKVAEKNGLIVKPTEDTKAFHAILKKTGGRDGFGIHPENYYETMLKNLGGNAQLLMAYSGETPIAGGIFVYLEEWGIYYYGASDHEHRQWMAPYLIQWAAIREAKKRGCRFYDFLGIAPEGAKNHAWAGVTDFKKKFGGRVVSYPQAVEWVLSPFWCGLYGLYKKLKG